MEFLFWPFLQVVKVWSWIMEQPALKKTIKLVYTLTLHYIILHFWKNEVIFAPPSSILVYMSLDALFVQFCIT